MTRVFRILGTGMLALAVMTGLALSLIYLASEPQLRRTYVVALTPIVVPTDAASIIEGRRLATIRGCNDGCHGKGVSGTVFWDDPGIVKMVAPDLTRVAAQLSDPELERVIRHGVRKNGHTTWGMPSSMYYHLSDEDLGRIIAFLRSLPVGNGPEAEVRFGPLGRIEILKNPLYAYAEEIAQGAPWMTEADARGEYGRGRYFALTVCTECHGMSLDGAYDGSAPNLVIVAAYSKPAFEELMATGVPVGGQKLDLMEEVARERFSHFTKDEVDALYNYLSARARGSVD
jgi:cytochrome c553